MFIPACPQTPAMCPEQFPYGRRDVSRLRCQGGVAEGGGDHFRHLASGGEEAEDSCISPQDMGRDPGGMVPLGF